MHLHAPLFRVPARLVIEILQIEFRVEISIQAAEQIQVERRGHAERVVVGGDQGGSGLHEVGAEEESVAGAQPSPDLAKKFARLRGLEVSDRASEKEQEEPFVGAAA